MAFSPSRTATTRIAWCPCWPAGPIMLSLERESVCPKNIKKTWQKHETKLDQNGISQKFPKRSDTNSLKGPHCWMWPAPTAPRHALKTWVWAEWRRRLRATNTVPPAKPGGVCRTKQRKPSACDLFVCDSFC